MYTPYLVIARLSFGLDSEAIDMQWTYVMIEHVAEYIEMRGFGKVRSAVILTVCSIHNRLRQHSIT